MRIEHTIEIAAPADRVWELTLDVEKWPELTPTITSVKRLDGGPMAVGSQARIKQPAQGTRVWTVTDLEPKRHFVWSTKVMGSRMTGGHHLSQGATGTTNRLTVDIEGPFAPVLGVLLRRPILNAITKENQGFKRAAEA
ncbi:MAG: SRPBCC family protein [Dehalococcoidia bacterium]|nr:SRPBCC family protein [Dehalococcoidia bacterium]HRC62102.1 SRPBCC family protein [Dehalococcoidia bacterium]